MNPTPVHVLSAVEAARRIYNTTSPTAEQVGRVVQKIEQGRLARSAKGGPTTTAESVAEYLTRKETAQARQHRGQAGLSGKLPPPASLSHLYDPLQPLYKGLLRDYFLAVVLRRKIGHRSKAFHSSVIATQCLLLVGLVGLIWFATDRAVKGRFVPPEERAVKAWLDQHFEKVQLQSVELTSREPMRVRARYSYFVNDRKINSEQQFALEGGQVTRIVGGED
jgi:hypothetical protein